VLNGNGAANRTAIAATITGLNIANGSTFWIRWIDFDISSSDDGLAVDDFSLTPSVVSVATNPSGVGSASPNLLLPSASTLLTVAATAGTNPPSTGLTVTCNLAAIGGSATQTLFDDGTNGDVVAANNTFSFQATVPSGTAANTYTLPCTIADAQSRSESVPIGLTVQPPVVAIHDIQGAGHLSPLAGQIVSTLGIVTARSGNGFWLQDSSPDANDATSEGIFVFTSSAPTVAVGDSVRLSARVQEFRPGSASNGNLTTTELTTPSIAPLSAGNPLPAATVVGNGGRIPPSTVIEDDATGSAETSGVFDPASDGLDFWESLEGMRVQFNNPVAVGPTAASFGETPIVGDNGANASLRTARGGLVIRPDDFNPERVVLDDLLVPGLPVMNVGDHYQGAVVGILDYNFGNFFLEATAVPTVVHDGVTPESTLAPAVNQLLVATFNVENLAPGDPASKFARLAGLIVNNLQAPDVLAIEEIQDNNGATDNGTVSATSTWSTLIAAIQTANGPAYDYRQIDPVNDQDGGQPGGNIRQGFLFRTDRGLAFVDRAGAGSMTPNTVVGTGPDTRLAFSPGRIDPTNTAFDNSRKPLAGEFMFRGHHLFVIANHFNSKGGDDPLMGRFQPPVRVSEAQRHQQAQIEHDFVDAIVTADPTAEVVVMGDLNDFEFSETVTILKGTPGILNDLMDTLPPNERYSYVFEGNSQTLDHILFSNELFSGPFTYDVVHVNSEFADQASDHEPQVALITLDDPPTVSGGGPYTVSEGGAVTVTASGSDPNGDALSYAWDLDDNGSFETSGQTVSFSAALLDGSSSPTIKVRATDPGGLSVSAPATVNVLNVRPTVSTPSVTPEPSVLGASATASATFTDPGPDSFTCTVDYGDGSGPLPGTVVVKTCTGPTHTYTSVGTKTVTVAVTDDDGGTGTANASHSVGFTFTGFFNPVDNLPTANRVKAGRAIPVKFSLGGNQGLGVIASFTSAPVACSTGTPTDDADVTVTAGHSSLQYDPTTATYTYVWKTDQSWATQCRLLAMTLTDGTVQKALFTFTK